MALSASMESLQLCTDTPHFADEGKTRIRRRLPEDDKRAKENGTLQNQMDAEIYIGQKDF